jgi:hypothetical protein
VRDKSALHIKERGDRREGQMIRKKRKENEREREREAKERPREGSTTTACLLICGLQTYNKKRRNQGKGMLALKPECVIEERKKSDSKRSPSRKL